MSMSMSISMSSCNLCFRSPNIFILYEIICLFSRCHSSIWLLQFLRRIFFYGGGWTSSCSMSQSKQNKKVIWICLPSVPSLPSLPSLPTLLSLRLFSSLLLELWNTTHSSCRRDGSDWSDWRNGRDVSDGHDGSDGDVDTHIAGVSYLYWGKACFL